MPADWDFWVRLLAVAGVALGAYRAYRHGVDAGQFSPKSFFLIVALGLGYAAVGIALMLALAELLGPGNAGAVMAVFVAYLVLGVLVVVWLAIRIARKYPAK